MDLLADQYIRVKVVLPRPALIPLCAAADPLSDTASSPTAAAGVNTHSPPGACGRDRATPAPAADAFRSAVAATHVCVAATPRSLASFLVTVPDPTCLGPTEPSISKGGHRGERQHQQQQQRQHPQHRLGLEDEPQQQRPKQHHGEQRRRGAKRLQKHAKADKQQQRTEQTWQEQTENERQPQRGLRQHAEGEQQQQANAEKQRQQTEKRRHELQETPEQQPPPLVNERQRRAEQQQIQEEQQARCSEAGAEQQKDAAVFLEADVALHETVADLRGVLLELLPSCLLTNYCVKWKDTLLQETVPFSLIGLQQQDDLLLMPLRYDAAALLVHLQRFKAIALGCSNSVALNATPATSGVVTATEEEDAVVEADAGGLVTAATEETAAGAGSARAAPEQEAVAAKWKAAAAEPLLLMRELPDPADPAGPYGLFLKPLVLQQLRQHNKETQHEEQQPQQKKLLPKELHMLQQQQEQMLLALDDETVSACCCATQPATQLAGSGQQSSCSTICCSCGGHDSCSSGRGAVAREKVDATAAIGNIASGGDSTKMQQAQQSKNRKQQQKQLQQDGQQVQQQKRQLRTQLKKILHQQQGKPEQQNVKQWQGHLKLDSGEAEVAAAATAGKGTLNNQSDRARGKQIGNGQSYSSGSSTHDHPVDSEDCRSNRSSRSNKSRLHCSSYHPGNTGMKDHPSGKTENTVSGETQQLRSSERGSGSLAGDLRKVTSQALIPAAKIPVAASPGRKRTVYKKCVCCSRLDTVLLTSPSGPAPPPGSPCVRRLEWHFFSSPSSSSRTGELARLRLLTLEDQLLHICCRAEGFHVFAITQHMPWLYDASSPEEQRAPGASSTTTVSSASPRCLRDRSFALASAAAGTHLPRAAASTALSASAAAPSASAAAIPTSAPALPASAALPASSAPPASAAPLASAARFASTSFASAASAADAHAGAACPLPSSSKSWLSASAKCVCLPADKTKMSLSVSDAAAAAYIFSSLGDLLAAYSPQFITRMQALAPPELDADLPYRLMPLLRARSHFLAPASPSCCCGPALDKTECFLSSKKQTSCDQSGRKTGCSSPERGTHSSKGTDARCSVQKDRHSGGHHEPAAATGAAVGFEKAAVTAHLQVEVSGPEADDQSERKTPEKKQRGQLHFLRDEAAAADVDQAPAVEEENDRCWYSDAAHVRQMHAESLQDVLQREKAAFKLYYDFQQTALCAVECLRERLAQAACSRSEGSSSSSRDSTNERSCSAKESSRRSSRDSTTGSSAALGVDRFAWRGTGNPHVLTSRGIQFLVAEADEWPSVGETQHQQQQHPTQHQLQREAHNQAVRVAARRKHQLFSRQELRAEMRGLELLERLQVFHGGVPVADPSAASTAADAMTAADPLAAADAAATTDATATASAAATGRPAKAEAARQEKNGGAAAAAEPEAARDTSAMGSTGAASLPARRETENLGEAALDGSPQKGKRSTNKQEEAQNQKHQRTSQSTNTQEQQQREHEQQDKQQHALGRQQRVQQESRDGNRGGEGMAAWTLAASYGILIDYEGIRVACRAPLPSLLRQKSLGESACLRAAATGAAVDDPAGTLGRGHASGDGRPAEELTSGTAARAALTEDTREPALEADDYTAGATRGIVTEAKTVAAAAAEELLETRLRSLFGLQRPHPSGWQTPLPLVSSVPWAADPEQRRIHLLRTGGLLPIDCSSRLQQHEDSDTGDDAPATPRAKTAAPAAASPLAGTPEATPLGRTALPAEGEQNGGGAETATALAEAAKKEGAAAEGTTARASGRELHEADGGAADAEEVQETKFLRPELLAAYLAFRKRRGAVAAARCRPTAPSSSSSGNSKDERAAGEEETGGDTALLYSSSSAVAVEHAAAVRAEAAEKHTVAAQRRAAAAATSNATTPPAESAEAAASRSAAAAAPTSTAAEQEAELRKNASTPVVAAAAAAFEAKSAADVGDTGNETVWDAFGVPAAASEARETLVYSFDKELQYRLEQEMNRRLPLMLSGVLTYMRCWCKQNGGLGLLEARGDAIAAAASGFSAALVTPSSAFSSAAAFASVDGTAARPRAPAADEKKELPMRERLLPLVERVLLRCLLTSKAEQRASFYEQKELLLGREPQVIELHEGVAEKGERRVQQPAKEKFVKRVQAGDGTAEQQQRHRRRQKQQQQQQSKRQQRGREKRQVQVEQQGTQVHQQQQHHIEQRQEERKQKPQQEGEGQRQPQKQQDGVREQQEPDSCSSNGVAPDTIGEEAAREREKQQDFEEELLAFSLPSEDLELLQSLPMDIDVSLLLEGLDIPTRAQQMAAELLLRALALPSLGGCCCPHAAPIAATEHAGNNTDFQRAGIAEGATDGATAVAAALAACETQPPPLGGQQQLQQQKLQRPVGLPQNEVLQHGEFLPLKGAAGAEESNFWEVDPCWTLCGQEADAATPAFLCTAAVAAGPPTAPFQGAGSKVSAPAAAAAATPGDASLASAAAVAAPSPSVSGERAADRQNPQQRCRSCCSSSDDLAVVSWCGAEDKRCSGYDLLCSAAATKGGRREPTAAFASVREAAVYLHSVAIPLLCELLVQQVATNLILESNTVKQLFHYCGVNLRYIGAVATNLQGRILSTFVSCLKTAAGPDKEPAVPAASQASSAFSFDSDAAAAAYKVVSAASRASSAPATAARLPAGERAAVGAASSNEYSIVADSSSGSGDTPSRSSSRSSRVCFSHHHRTDDNGGSIVTTKNTSSNSSSTEGKNLSGTTRVEHQLVVLRVLLLELAIRCATHCFNTILSHVCQEQVAAASVHLLSCLLCPETVDYPSKLFPVPFSVARFASASCACYKLRDAHRMPQRQQEQQRQRRQQQEQTQPQQQEEQQQLRQAQQKHHVGGYGSGVSPMWGTEEEQAGGTNCAEEGTTFAAPVLWWDITARDLWKRMELRMRTHFNYHAVLPSGNGDIRAAWTWLAKPSSRYRLLRGVCCAVGIQLNASHQFAAFLSTSPSLRILDPWHDTHAPAVAAGLAAPAAAGGLAAAAAPRPLPENAAGACTHAAAAASAESAKKDRLAGQNKVASQRDKKGSAAAVSPRLPGTLNMKLSGASTETTDQKAPASSPVLPTPEEKAHALALSVRGDATQQTTTFCPPVCVSSSEEGRRSCSREGGRQAAHRNTSNSRTTFTSSSDDSAIASSNGSNDSSPSSSSGNRTERRLQVAEACVVPPRGLGSPARKDTAAATAEIATASEEVAEGEIAAALEKTATGAAAQAATPTDAKKAGTPKTDTQQSARGLRLLLWEKHPRRADEARGNSSGTQRRAADAAAAATAMQAEKRDLTPQQQQRASGKQQQDQKRSSKQEQQEGQEKSVQQRLQQGQRSSAEQQQQQDQRQSETASRSWQPLQMDSFCRCFPVLKTKQIVSLLVRGLLAIATEACALGWLDVALELYQQTLYIIHQLTGAVCREAALCYAAMGHVMLALDEYLNACNYFQKALILTERCEGIDHPATIELHAALSRALAELPGEVYMRRSMQHVLRALLLLRLWGGTATAAQEMAVLLLLAAKRTQQGQQLYGKRRSSNTSRSGNSSGSSSSTQDAGGSYSSSGGRDEEILSNSSSSTEETRGGNRTKKKNSKSVLHEQQPRADGGGCSWASSQQQEKCHSRNTRTAQELQQQSSGSGSGSAFESQQQQLQKRNRRRNSADDVDFFLSKATSLLETVQGQNPIHLAELHIDISQCYYGQENFRKALHHCRRAHQLLSSNRHSAAATTADEVHFKKVEEHLLFLTHETVLAEKRQRSAVTQREELVRRLRAVMHHKRNGKLVIR